MKNAIAPDFTLTTLEEPPHIAINSRGKRLEGMNCGGNLPWYCAFVL